MFATRFVAVNVRLFRSCVHAMVVRRKIRDVKGVALGQNSSTMGATFGDRRVRPRSPAPYGIEANRPTLEALVQCMVEHSFIAKPIPIEDLFVVGD